MIQLLLNSTHLGQFVPNLDRTCPKFAELVEISARLLDVRLNIDRIWRNSCHTRPNMARIGPFSDEAVQNLVQQGHIGCGDMSGTRAAHERHVNGAPHERHVGGTWAAYEGHRIRTSMQGGANTKVVRRIISLNDGRSDVRRADRFASFPENMPREFIFTERG